MILNLIAIIFDVAVILYVLLNKQSNDKTNMYHEQANKNNDKC